MPEVGFTRKVRFVQIAPVFNPGNGITRLWALDTEGRVWHGIPKRRNPEWRLVVMPDEPEREAYR
jgi:hypothetical protein